MRIGLRKTPDDKRSPEEKALEAKIDDMMKPEQDRPLTASKPEVKPAATAQPSIDIFKDLSTAPAVPKDLLKQIGASKPETAPAKVSTVGKPIQPPAETNDSAPAPSPTLDEPILDDEVTDKAVDEIAASDSDELLAHQDAASQGDSRPAPKRSFKDKIAALLRNKWTWIGLAVVLLAVLAVPYTRYKILGLVIKKPVVVSVIDSKTNTAVSSAEITINGQTVKTEADGKATINAPLGPDNLQISKQYYTTTTQKVFVGFTSSGPVLVKLNATGRQVPIKVLNSITGKPLSDVTISVLHTSAKTDINGLATIVLPTKQSSDAAQISSDGYNTQNVTVTVISTQSDLNTFNLTPSGHVYFLSNLSGNIDVVKTNLDGSDRHTVLAGTGSEDPASTSLLASRDWNFLVLKAKRGSGPAALYLIDASTDKVTQFDGGNYNFNLIGWYGHNFVYEADNNATQNYQNGRQILKSYNADAGALNQLDQSQAQGDANNYGYQTFSNYYILDNEVAYTVTWSSSDSGGSFDLSTVNDSVRLVQPGGQNKKDIQTWPANTVSYIQAVLAEPQEIYYSLYNTNTNQTTYYHLENQTVSSDSSLSQTTFSQPYPTYLLSPSGQQTFWTELRDGKNILFTGDKNAQNSKQLASLSTYTPYGWYSDSYVLVSRDSSQLYIMPAGGLSANQQQPLKITDYYKPNTTYNGYGYGYGGL